MAQKKVKNTHNSKRNCNKSKTIFTSKKKSRNVIRKSVNSRKRAIKYNRNIPKGQTLYSIVKQKKAISECETKAKLDEKAKSNCNAITNGKKVVFCESLKSNKSISDNTQKICTSKKLKSILKKHNSLNTVTNDVDYAICNSFANLVKDQDTKMSVNNYGSEYRKSDASRIRQKLEKQIRLQSRMNSISDAEYDLLESKNNLNSQSIHKGVAYHKLEEGKTREVNDWSDICRKASEKLNTTIIGCQDDSDISSLTNTDKYLSSKLSKMNLFGKYNIEETTKQLLCQPIVKLETVPLKQSIELEIPCVDLTDCTIRRIEPPKPITQPFVYFVAKQRMLDQKQSGRLGTRPVVQLDDASLMKRWNVMSNFEKKPFVEKARKDRTRFIDHSRIYRRRCNNRRH